MAASIIMSRVKTAFAVLMGGEVKGKSLSAEGALFDIYGREILDGSDYFHPNQVKGIPVFDTNSIMEQHRGYVKEIERISGMGDHHRTDDGKVLLKELYEMVIRRFIEYVHLLPASESHHHSVPGGMLIHGLEVSSWSLRSAKNVKPASTGMLDIDKRLEPSYRYAAWVGGLMHDIGKLTADMNVFAVTIYDKETQSNKKVRDNIPHWQPERESLIQWAKRFNIATYSVTFKSGRVHNQHNSVTSSLLSPVLGNGAALDKLLTSPVNIHLELSKVLNGTESKCEYLKRAIRVGDNKSTGDNLKVFQHLKLGPGKLSTAAMIYRSIQWSRPQWVINKPNGHAWVIGDDVYLRYTSAFDVIQKEAQSNGYHVTNQSQSLLEIMADDNMIEKYSDDSWSVKYVGGVFNESDIADIRSGRQSMGWESVIKVMWRGVVFGSDPVPDSAPGIMLLPDTELLILVKTDGTTQEFPKPITLDVNESPKDVVDSKSTDTQQALSLSEPVTIEKEQSPSTDVKSTAPAIAPVKSNPPAKKAKKTDSKRKGLKFNNAPTKKVQEFKPSPAQVKQQKVHSQSLSLEVIQFWERAVFVKNAPKSTNLIHLNDSVKVLGMPLQELAMKAKADGIIVPNESAPLKIVTIHNDKPCLHVSVSPAVVKASRAKKADVQSDAVTKVVIEQNSKSKAIWADAKERECDYEIKMITKAATSKHTLGHAISVVIEYDLQDKCLIQTADGLMINVSEFTSALIETGKYKTLARTIYNALDAAAISNVPECSELFVVPYAKLNSIKVRMREA